MIRSTLVLVASRRLLRRTAALGVFILSSAVIASGCGSDDPTADDVTADSTCAEYLELPGDERSDVAVRISAQIDGVSSPGNPMWGPTLDSACGTDESMTLQEFFTGGAVPTGTTGAGGDQSSAATTDEAPSEGASPPPEGTAGAATLSTIKSIVPEAADSLYAEFIDGRLVLNTIEPGGEESIRDRCDEILASTAASGVYVNVSDIDGNRDERICGEGPRVLGPVFDP